MKLLKHILFLFILISYFLIHNAFEDFHQQETMYDLISDGTTTSKSHKDPKSHILAVIGNNMCLLNTGRLSKIAFHWEIFLACQYVLSCPYKIEVTYVLFFADSQMGKTESHQ